MFEDRHAFLRGLGYVARGNRCSSIVNAKLPKAGGGSGLDSPTAAFDVVGDDPQEEDALRAAALNRSETLRVPESSAPSPTLPGRHAPIDHLGQHFWPHVAEDVRLVLDPTVRVDPFDQVLHHQLWRRGILVPSRFRAREWHPVRSVEALTSDCGRRATTPTVGAQRLPERPAHTPARVVKQLQPLDRTAECGIEGLRRHDVGREPGGQVTWRPARNALTARC